MKIPGTRIKFSISPAAPAAWAALAALGSPAWIAALIGALALHEAGHLAAMRAFCVAVKAVRIRAVGIEITRADKLTSYRADAAVALAGPAASFIGAAALAAPVAAIRCFGAASLALGALNILPVRGLDGGAAAQALITRALGADRARPVLRGISLFFAAALWLFACWIFLVTAGNFSLFALAAILLAANADA